MTLEEAKKKLIEWIKCEEVTIRTEEGDIEVYQERLELFKFVLNYIENESIPKNKVKEAIKYEKEIAKKPISSGCTMNQLHGYTAQVLEELLGE